MKLLSVDDIMSDDWHDAGVNVQQWKFSNAKVLVVDDAAENRELLEVLLTDVGIEVVIAENGQIALDLVSDESINMVLMDVQMPVMDGYTAVGLMRERNHTLPVIAMTADAMLGAEQRCLDAGYSEYMTKPVEIDLLINRLADLLDGEPLSKEERDERRQAENEVDVADNEQFGEQDKIVSSLSMTNKKLHGIVQKFIVRLGDQLETIDSAWSRRDYEELQKLGHWLKGSAGSVGFSQFVTPAREFEHYAIEKDDANIADSIQVIRSIYQRLSVEPVQEIKPVLELVPSRKEYSIPDTVTSRLMEAKPKLRPVIGKFVSQLSAKCDGVEAAVALSDYQEIEKFGHWLKASAGSVGFNAFTEPARDLENHAKERQMESVQHTVDVIRQLSSRINLEEE